MENAERETSVFHRMCQHHPNVGTCSASRGFKIVRPSSQSEVANQATSLIAGRCGQCEYPEGNRSSSRRYGIKGGERASNPLDGGGETSQGTQTLAFRQVPATLDAAGALRVCLSTAQGLKLLATRRQD